VGARSGRKSDSGAEAEVGVGARMADDDREKAEKLGAVDVD